MIWTEKLPAIPQIEPAVFHFSEGDLHLLVHPTLTAWLVLNRTGYEIASLCNGRNSLAQIAGHLTDTYGLDPATASLQANQYVESLGEKGWFCSPAACMPTESESKSKSTTRLESIYLQLTERCNLRCRHCYAWGGSHSPAELSFPQIKILIDTAKELGVVFLTLSGGEPLLHPSFKEILRYAAGLKLQVLSNGTLIDDAWADMLAKSGARVQISLDGASPAAHDYIRGEGSFAKSVQGIRLLRKAGAEVIICTVNMQNNLQEQEKLEKLARDCGAQLRFIPLRCSGRAQGDWQNLAPAKTDYTAFYRRHFSACSRKITGSCGLSGLVLNLPRSAEPQWCPIGRSLNIDARGSVHPCLFLLEEKYCLGNINQSGLPDIFSSAALEDLRQIRNRRSREIPKCRNCAWKNLCQGGCLGLAYSQKGSIWETDDFCDLRRELYPQIIFNLAKRKLALG